MMANKQSNYKKAIFSIYSANVLMSSPGNNRELNYCITLRYFWEQGHQFDIQFYEGKKKL